MATIKVNNLKKILVGIFLCAAAGMAQFFLSGSSVAIADENHGSREATVTLTKTKHLTQTPAPRFTLTTTVQLPTYEWMRATENVLFPWCGPDNWRLYSNNRDWVATHCINFSMGVYNVKDLRKNFYFTFREVFGSKYENGNGDGRIVPVRFSHDAKNFYFTVYHPGDGGCPSYSYNLALLRLNLKTGTFSELVPPVEHTSFDFSFSNDDKLLGYLQKGLKNSSLFVLDIEKNKLHEIPLDDNYTDSGNIIWSPDDGQLIFSARTGEDCFEMNYSVISLDLKNLNQKVIVKGSAKMILPIQWIDTEHLLVITGFDPVYSILNITTGELEPESHPEAIPTGLAY